MSRIEPFVMPEDERLTMLQALLRTKPTNSKTIKFFLLFKPWRMCIDSKVVRYKVLRGSVYYLDILLPEE